MSAALNLPRIFLAQSEMKDKKTKSSAPPSGSSLWSNYSRPQLKSSSAAKSGGKKKSKQEKKKSKVVEEEKDTEMLNPEPETKRVEIQWRLDIPIRPQTPLDDSLGSLMRDDVSQVSPKGVPHNNSKPDDDDEPVSPCGTPAHTFFLDGDDADEISRCQSRQTDSKELNADDLEEPVSPCGTPFKNEFSVKKEEDTIILQTNQPDIESARSSTSALSSTNNEQTTTQSPSTRPLNINFKLPEKASLSLPNRKQSDLVSMRSNATSSSDAVSPVASTFSPPLGDGVRRVSNMTARTSIVSPLDMPPRKSFAIPKLDDTIEEGLSRKPSVSENTCEPVPAEESEQRKSTEGAGSRKSSVTLQNSDSGIIFHLDKAGSEEEIVSRGSSETQQSADSSTGSDFTRKASISSSYSVVSSKSSYSSDAKETEAPLNKHLEIDVRSLKAYSIISPVSAGVFDDEHPQLRRVPTFKKRLTIKESKNKPLPAEPAIQIPPLLIRRAQSEQRTRKHSKQDALNRPRFLSTNPCQSDLDSLDEAFRRSGLTSDPVREMSPSLRQAAQELEDQLSSMSLKSGYSLVTSPRQSVPIPERRYTDNTLRYPHEFPPEKSRKKSAPAPSLRAHGRRRSEEDMPKLPKPKAPERAKGHSFFKNDATKQTPKKKSSRSVFSSKQSPQADDRNNEVENLESQESTSSRCSSRLSTQSQPVGEKASQGLSSTRSRKGGERSLRLRLPRLKTSQLLAPQISAPTNLSIVSEASSNPDLTSKSNFGNEGGLTAEDKIRAAITGLDRLQTQEPSHPQRHEAVELDCVKERSTASSILELDAHCIQIPQLAAESILLRIMQNADTFRDLFTLATLNRAFYQVFKRNELDLMKGTLFRMSPAAWELREMSPPWEAEGHETADIDMPVPEYTPNSYIRHYTRDLFTMVALKSLILVRCESFLRPDTVRALAGLDEARSIQVDEAFWRVWTFCRLFGCGKGREDDIAAQADWLNGGQLTKVDSRGTSTVLTYPFEVNGGLFDPPEGFGKGNGIGLNSRELFDMMEIWTCLGVLLQIFHGECKVARRFGVFDNSDIKEGEIAQEEGFLEEWTQYLLTLGPSAILAVISINPESTIDSMFERAQSLGWTKWTSPTQAQGGARRWFLREAISRVYESQLLKQENVSGVASRSPGTSAQVTRSPSPGHGLPSSEGSVRTQESDVSRQRQAGFALELRRRRRETQDSPDGNAAPAQDRGFRDERPISNFSDVMNVLEGREPSEVPKVPSIPAAFAMHNTATPQTPVVPQVSVVPPPGSAPTETAPAASVPDPVPEEPPVVEEKISQGRYPRHIEILDPVDRAMHKMVNELGFSEQDAKWALKITDTGESLDVDAAISLLVQQQNGGQMDRAASTSNDDMAFRTAAFKPTVTSDNVWRPIWRWA